MTDRTAIRTGLLLNSFGFLASCVALSFLPVSVLGALGALTMAVAALSYTLQEAAAHLGDAGLENKATHVWALLLAVLSWILGAATVVALLVRLF